MRSLLFATAAFSLLACGPAEVRVGASDGIPPVKGSSTVSLDNFTCGQPIPAGDYQVTTATVAAGCQLTFDHDVQVLTAADYQKIPALQGSSNLVQAVELQVTQLAFTDATTNTALDLNTQVVSATLSVNGQQVADKAALANLPTTVTLQGDALTELKAKVDARQPASVHATSVVVIPSSPPPPKQLKIDYDAQPTLVLGPGKVNLPQP